VRDEIHVRNFIIKTRLEETRDKFWKPRHKRYNDRPIVLNVSKYAECGLGGLEPGDVLSPLLFNFGLDFTIRKVQEIQMGPK
jgi:hypothetical protein